jgi:hypothetical protein
VQPGELYRHEAFYRSAETGRLEPKYLVILATPLAISSHDCQQAGRTDVPYNLRASTAARIRAFFSASSVAPSRPIRVDLRHLDDFDEFEFQRRSKSKRILPTTSLSKNVLAQLLDCTAAAEDTTRLQERAIRDALAKLR